MSQIAVAVPDCATVPRRHPVALQLRKGADVMCRGCAVRILSIVSETQVWVRVHGTEDTWWVSADECSGFVPESAPPPADPSANEPEEPESDELARAERWVALFREHAEEDYLPVPGKVAIRLAMDVDRRSVERHFALYVADPSPAGQLPGKHGPDEGSTYLTPAAEAIVKKTIEDEYERPERPNIQAVVIEARRRCQAAGIKKLPCYDTVSRRIHERDRWKAARRRHGRVRGDAKAGPAGKPCRVTKALAFVQMDHAIVDVILVDPKTRREIGRPWITLAIDVATRCVLGFYLTYDDPSQTSVALALEHACCPKDAWLKSIGVKGEWLPMGLMKVMGWDNAKCFKNTRLLSSARKAGIDARPRQIRRPTHGAHIERLIGTFMGKVHLLKGTTFSNTKDREDYDSQKKAVMSLPEFIAWTAHQINGVYHNTPHSGIGNRTPLQAWKEAWSEGGSYQLPPIPADRRAFLLSLLPGIQRGVTREGIARFALQYWDEALIPFIRDGKRYFIAHDPRDISKVHMEVGEHYFDIPWRDQTKPPVALWEWERSKREVRDLLDRAGNETEVFLHLKETREIERKAEAESRKARRNEARRPVDSTTGTEKPSVDYGEECTVLTNPLEVGHGH